MSKLTILSLSRELRDQIYKEFTSDEIHIALFRTDNVGYALSFAPGSARDVSALLHTCRAIRDEVQETSSLFAPRSAIIDLPQKRKMNWPSQAWENIPLSLLQSLQEIRVRKNYGLMSPGDTSASAQIEELSVKLAFDSTKGVWTIASLDWTVKRQYIGSEVLGGNRNISYYLLRLRQERKIGHRFEALERLLVRDRLVGWQTLAEVIAEQFMPAQGQELGGASGSFVAPKRMRAILQELGL